MAFTIDMLSGVVVYLPLILILRKNVRKDEPKKYLLLILFTLYLSKMYDVVGIPAVQYMHWNPTINLIPFHDYGHDAYNFQIGMNAVMFVPLGFMLPLIWERYRSFLHTFFAGLLTSLAIEIMQLSCVRVTDIDDLIMNTLGCLIGFGFSYLIFGRKWKKDQKETPKETLQKDIWECLIIHVIILVVIIFVRTPIMIAIYNLLMSV